MLCGPGFGEGGKGPTWGYIYGLQWLSFPSSFLSFYFVPAAAFFLLLLRRPSGVWLGVFLANARLAQGCFDG